MMPARLQRGAPGAPHPFNPALDLRDGLCDVVRS